MGRAVEVEGRTFHLCHTCVYIIYKVPVFLPHKGYGSGGWGRLIPGEVSAQPEAPVSQDHRLEGDSLRIGREIVSS